MLTRTVTFFYAGTFAVIKKASRTPAARLTLHRVLRRRTYRSYGVTENDAHLYVFFIFTIELWTIHIAFNSLEKLQLTQSSASRFKHVRAHCSPSSPAPAVAQSKYTFGERHAVAEEEIALF